MLYCPSDAPGHSWLNEEIYDDYYLLNKEVNSLCTRAELLEAWLALTQVKYHGNL